MKNFHISLLLVIVILMLLCSCNDIGDLGNNSSKDKIGTTLSAKDTLGFLEMPPINLDTLAKGRIIYQTVIFRNISDTIDIVITSVQFKNNIGFSLTPALGFPVVILPKQVNSDNYFLAQFNTNLVPKGYYKDTIYFNWQTKFYTTIEVYVK